MNRQNRIFVLLIVFMLAAVLITNAAGTVFLNAYYYSFRAWELIESGRNDSPFKPMTKYEKEIHGDLANALRVSRFKQKRQQTFSTDQFGYRNPVVAGRTHYPIVVVGDSDMAGASLSDGETFSRQLSGLLDMGVYNYAPNWPLNILNDERFEDNLPEVLIWEAIERTIISAENPQVFAIDRGSMPRLVHHHASWLFNDIRWQLIGSAPYLNSSIAHVSPTTSMMFYDMGVKTLNMTAAERGLEQTLATINEVRMILAEHGVQLVYMPLPDKENIYQHLLPELMRPEHDSDAFLVDLGQGLDHLGVVNVKLYDVFRERSGEDLYLLDDTHWSPHGVQVAADHTAQLILGLGLELK